MMKTQTAVEQDFFDALKQCSIAGFVRGEVYKSRTRPLNSTAEDIVIIPTALSASQLQSGVVTILIYSKGIKKNSNILPDLERISLIESKAISLPSELKKILTSYDGIEFQNAISYAYDDEVEQYFISVRINYKYLT